MGARNCMESRGAHADKQRPNSESTFPPFLTFHFNNRGRMFVYRISA